MLTSRRAFLKTGMVAAGAAATVVPASAAQPQAAAAGAPLLHVTDLFHPHGDPDDHFDLAVTYALVQRGCFDLRGVVIDYPPDFRAGDPAVVAVTQMNRLSGLSAPVSIGTSHRLKNRADALVDASAQETAAVRFILAQLRAADRPLALMCVGSAADIIVAALREPALFKAKCAGVYLNSGAAHDNPANPAQLEFNVRLDPAAYAAMFDLPCPLYWFPCWHTTERRESGADGSFYWLPHAEALGDISSGLANYFAYMFDKSANPKWLRAMTAMPPGATWDKILNDKRGMWSTASQFAAAGFSVTKEGEIVLAKDAGRAAVFAALPVEVSCADDGRTTWRRVEAPTGRWMLSVTDVARYPAAMTRAVGTLFKAFR
ncbi:MAG TPA: nucleoside hydrolase [Kiritimatiellia bacterium]|nr:nucleoside hydrolase [Kiritimatiellia bacterium]HPS09014.1 nucleoside hydrolase [Kiritimatiellia bacterium]